jgi:hypothetical protein
MAAPKSKNKPKKSVKSAKTDDYWVFENPDKTASVHGATPQSLSFPWRHVIVGPSESGKCVLLLN